MNFLSRDRIFVHNNVILAVMKAEFLTDRMSCIIGVVLCRICLSKLKGKEVIKRTVVLRGIRARILSVSKHNMKILFGDFFVKLLREDIFKPTSVDESLQERSNTSGFRE